MEETAENRSSEPVPKTDTQNDSQSKTKKLSNEKSDQEVRDIIESENEKEKEKQKQLLLNHIKEANSQKQKEKEKENSEPLLDKEKTIKLKGNLPEPEKVQNEPINNICGETISADDEYEKKEKKEEKFPKKSLYNEYYQYTIEDLDNNPKKRVPVNSPRSLRAIYETGCTLEELYFKPLNSFLDHHKEIFYISKKEQIKRYEEYENLRVNKIKDLCQYREFLIRNEDKQTQNIPTISREQKLQDKYLENVSNDKISIKNIILNNQERIANDELEVLKKQHNKELANIIELELDKDIFNLEMKKQEENYNKEYAKLNFLNLNGGEDNSVTETEEQLPQIQNKTEMKEKNKSVDKNSIRKKKSLISINDKNNYKDNLYVLQQAKINQKYEKNQKKIEKKLEQVEKINKIKVEQMALKKRIAEERAAQNLQKSAIEYANKQDSLIKEIQLKNLHIFQNKKKFNDKLLVQKEITNKKYSNMKDRIIELREYEENKRQEKYMKFLERQSKREKLKYEKTDILDSKKFRILYLNDERHRNINKIGEILTTGINDENLEKIINVFPDNTEIDNVIKRYHTRRKNIEKNKGKFGRTRRSFSNTNTCMNKNPNKGFHTSTRFWKKKTSDSNINSKNKRGFDTNSNNYMNSRKSAIEDDIKKKVSEFRDKAYKKFFDMVEEEKKKEQVRVEEFNSVSDEKIKNNLDKQFSKERALANLRLQRENIQIENKINNFEKTLRIKSSNENEKDVK